ncbi:MAG: DUF3365 domain-containing protein [Candidatus Marinimicrobia bacterium]|nr:DUF3365 domain-containing protein [Candidatus Neomarinimicrobiota bacterium]
MSNPDKSRTQATSVQGYMWALVAIWSVIVAASLAWSVQQQRLQTREVARMQARTAHAKDLSYRRWNAGRGGVYVPVTEEIQPSPHLADIPERDITTLTGKRLTLINPSYMTRLVHEQEEKENYILGHITSLKPIRPDNAADPWETGALQAFETGKMEVSLITEIGGATYMRLMRPLFIEEDCLQCHASQGYKMGDIRGGIAVSVPMEPLQAIALRSTLTFSLMHTVFWVLGMAGIGVGSRQIRRQISERNQIERALQDSEELFRGVVETAIAGIGITGADENLRFVNPAFAEMLGYTQEEMTGMNLPQLTNKDEYDKYQAFTVRRKQGLRDQYETTLRCKDGKTKDVLVSVAPLNDVDGTFKDTMAVIIDISERKQAEAALQKANDELERHVKERTADLTKVNQQLEKDIAKRKQAEREVIKISEKEQRRIAQDLHDDIGQQLVGIAYMFEVLSDKYASGATLNIEDFGRIEALTAEAIERLHAVALDLNPISVEGSDLSWSLQKLTENVQDNYGITCIFEQQGEPPRFGREIATNIYRIAQEAANNAVKHGAPNQVQISLVIRGDELVLTVKDDGVGIAEKELVSRGMGLKNMEYRSDLIGAKLDIIRDQDGGTVVSCAVKQNPVLKD